MDEAEDCVILCPRLKIIPGASYLCSHFQKAGLGLERRMLGYFLKNLLPSPRWLLCYKQLWEPGGPDRMEKISLPTSRLSL